MARSVGVWVWVGDVGVWVDGGWVGGAREPVGDLGNEPVDRTGDLGELPTGRCGQLVTEGPKDAGRRS